MRTDRRAVDRPVTRAGPGRFAGAKRLPAALPWPSRPERRRACRSGVECDGGSSGSRAGADRAPPTTADRPAPRPPRPGAALRRERPDRSDLRGHRSRRRDPRGRHPGWPDAGRARVVGVRCVLPQRPPDRRGVLGVPPAARLLLDDPRDGPRRPGPRSPSLARGRRRVHRHRGSHARPRPDRLGAARDGPHPDADRDGHGRRRVPAVRDRPRARPRCRRRGGRSDGAGVPAAECPRRARPVDTADHRRAWWWERSPSRCRDGSIRGPRPRSGSRPRCCRFPSGRCRR